MAPSSRQTNSDILWKNTESNKPKEFPTAPPSNGEVERHNETLLKILCIAKIEKFDVKREMEKFL